MKQRLAYRMALTYGIIFILAVIIIDISLIFIYRENQMKKNEKFYTGLCSMFSSMAENNIKITNYINSSEGLTGQNNGRVMLIDTSGKILLDSAGELAGVNITNPEFRKSAKNGEPAVGYYTYERKGMAIFSYPVFLNGNVSAVVQISVFIQDIYDDIQRFAVQIIAISVSVVILVILAAIYMGRQLTKPITKLTFAAEKISRGDIADSVEVKRNDELGLLAVSFNQMGRELQKIEVNRKRFISDVSHELKTPLASIKALVGALMPDETSDGELREYLNDIDHEIDRLSKLVTSLLNSARLEEMELKREQLLLSEEVELVIRALKPLADTKKIVLENVCDCSIAINADKNMFREVLINLIDNSIKYGVGSGFVRIECTKDCMKIIDNGVGIPAQDLHNIFDSFYRVDTSRTGEGGSGIGLFIVKRILQLHGFVISVDSAPGAGSTFTIRFHH